MFVKIIISFFHISFFSSECNPVFQNSYTIPTIARYAESRLDLLPRARAIVFCPSLSSALDSIYYTSPSRIWL